MTQHQLSEIVGRGHATILDDMLAFEFIKTSEGLIQAKVSSCRPIEDQLYRFADQVVDVKDGQSFTIKDIYGVQHTLQPIAIKANDFGA